eukprot:2417675-Prorocentrum_lima.AAC.1
MQQLDLEGGQNRIERRSGGTALLEPSVRDDQLGRRTELKVNLLVELTKQGDEIGRETKPAQERAVQGHLIKQERDGHGGETKQPQFQTYLFRAQERAKEE